MGYATLAYIKKSIKMETKNKIKDLLRKMKARRGNDTLILFHNGGSIEAYAEDAQIIAVELGFETFMQDELLTIRFPGDMQEENTNRLLNKGYAVCISEMRDSSGNFITDIAEYNE